MGFIDVLGDAFDAVGDAAGNSLGVVMDVAKAAPHTNTFSNRGQVTADWRNRREDYFQDHRVMAALAKGVGSAVSGSLEGLAAGISYGVMRPTSTTMQVLASRANSPWYDSGPDLGVGQAWDNSKRNSPGQVALAAFGLGPEDPARRYQDAWKWGTRGEDEFSTKFSLASGTIDAVLGWYVPVAPFKAAKVAREGATQFGPGDVEAIASGVATTRRQRKVVEQFNDIVTGTDGKTAYELAQMKFLRRSTAGATLAHLLARADGDHDTKRLILLSASGNLEAHRALAARRAVIAAQLDNATRDLDDLIMVERDALAGGGRFASLNNAADQDALKAEIEPLTDVMDQFNRIVGDLDKTKESFAKRGALSGDDIGIFGATANARVKKARYDESRMNTARTYTLQEGALGRVVRVMHAPTNYRPSGWFDLHDTDQSLRELEALTRRVPGLPAEKRNELIQRFLQAPDDNARRLTLQHTEEYLATFVARRLGYDEPDVMKMLGRMLSERDRMLAHFKTTNYGVMDDGGVMVVADRPLMETQLANGVMTLDIDHITRVLKRNKDRYRAMKWANEKWDVLEHGADMFNDLWKFQALFRLGYPMRNAIDSQLRLLAFLGGLQTMRLQTENAAVTTRRLAAQGHAKYRRPVVEQELAEAKAALKGVKGDERKVLKSRVERLQRELTELDSGTNLPPRFGANKEVEVGPYRLPDVFGRTEDEVRMRVNRTSATESNINLVRDEHNRLLNEFRGSGNWITRTGDDDRYVADYMRVVNNHLRQSVITQRLLAGQHPDDVIRWLKSSEGRDIRRRMVFGDDTAEDLVERNLTNLRHVLPEHMWEEVSKRPIRAKDVDEMFREVGSRPPINAEQIAYSLGDGLVARQYASIRDGYFKWVSKMTDDQLGRHPLYRQLYQGQARMLLNRADPKLKGELTPAELRIIEERARIFARREMKKVMFDVAQKTDMAHFVRFVMPFYAAWQDAVTKYGRIIVRDPSVLVRAGQLWMAPNDASFIEVVDTKTGKPVPGDKSQLTQDEAIRIPAKWARLLGMNYTLDLSKASLNIALQGDPIWLPGWGPMAQAPVNEWIRRADSPALAKAAQEMGILPFGVQDYGTLSYKAFLAGATRHMHMDDQRAARLKAMILQTELHRFAAGDRKTEPTPEEINRRFRDLRVLRWVTSVLSPASIQYKSPYQFYIDQSHSFDAQIGKKFKDSLEADAAFYEKHGEDFYLFRASMSENTTRVMASQEADKVARSVKDLIGKHAEYGFLFVGPNNRGEYDQNVYILQTLRRVSPLSNKHWRDTYEDPKTAFAKTNAEMGWIEYQKIQERIKVIMESRGLTSLQQKGAEDLRNIKDTWLRMVTGEGGPSWGRDWYKDYLDRDDSKIVKFLEAARDAVADKRINQRPDMIALNTYLMGRDAMRNVLAQRKAAGGSGTLAGNDDLEEVWAQFTSSIVEKYITFGDIYSRYLESDDLSAVA